MVSLLHRATIMMPYSLQESRRGAYLPSLGRSARKLLYHIACDAWPVRRYTYGYLPSHHYPLAGTHFPSHWA